MSSLQRNDPPPPYGPRNDLSTGPRVTAHESTPLIHRHRKRQLECCIIGIVIGFLLALVMISTILTLWVKLDLTGAQRQWERGLADRRLQEQSRIKHFEEQLKARQDREHLREEQWHREEEQRQRLGLYWGNLEADAHCTAYNTRYYWARLLNTVPYQYNWLKPCLDIPIDIHGKRVKAATCEVKDDGSVYGHWRVDFDEPGCIPYWDQFKDKGCVAPDSGLRRFEAHLANVRWGEDEWNLCITTPHDFFGMHFAEPLTCADWGKYGMFGIWEAYDGDC